MPAAGPRKIALAERNMMSDIHLSLLRVGESERGTFGVLRQGTIPFAVTLEPPWKDNTVGLSAIPPGTYRCVRMQSPHFGETFEITNVPGRSHVLFHKGNKLEDTEGCILVAEEFGGTPEMPVVWGVVMETGYPEAVVTLVSLGDRTTSLYFSNGGGIIQALSTTATEAGPGTRIWKNRS